MGVEIVSIGCLFPKPEDKGKRGWGGLVCLLAWWGNCLFSFSLRFQVGEGVGKRGNALEVFRRRAIIHCASVCESPGCSDVLNYACLSGVTVR